MLTLTENAVNEIQHLTDLPEAPESGGVRIAAEPGEGALTLSLVTQPAEGDAVVDASGAHLYLDREAAQLLHDKTLDASVDSNGDVQFALS